MKIYFIGIGGIGVSGLAFINLARGNMVAGSDSQGSEITEQLKAKGATVVIGHDARHITKDISLIVYSEAVPETNVELLRAKELGIKCLSGAQALAELAQNYFLIAVSGMHGKTTTASMIAKIMLEAELDPTYIIGTKNGWHFGQNPNVGLALNGKKYLIIEADDYKAKVLNYSPDILVLTNIEEEHLDYFRDLNHIIEVFKKYASQVKGLIIANKDDPNIKKVLTDAHAKIEYYQKANIKLTVPGEHNQHNARAALLVASALGIERKQALQSVKTFAGAWRRFEEFEIENCLETKNLKFKIISDYAHHPTEIEATLLAARQKYPDKHIWCFFQPHQYQRTFLLFDRFVKVLKKSINDQWVNKMFVVDIYDVEGRENKEAKAQVSAQKLATASNAQYLAKNEILNFVKKEAVGNEVIIFMGAGDIYDETLKLIHRAVI